MRKTSLNLAIFSVIFISLVALSSAYYDSDNLYYQPYQLSEESYNYHSESSSSSWHSESTTTRSSKDSYYSSTTTRDSSSSSSSSTTTITKSYEPQTVYVSPSFQPRQQYNYNYYIDINEPTCYRYSDNCYFTEPKSNYRYRPLYNPNKYTHSNDYYSNNYYYKPFYDPELEYYNWKF